MININYGMAYQYMVVLPIVQEKRELETPKDKSYLVEPVSNVEGSNVRKLRRDDGLGRNVDIYC